MLKHVVSLLVLFVLSSCSADDSNDESDTIANIASSVASGDITFNFAENYETGQFLDGQWWVHNNGGNVEITSITPDSFDDNGRVRNGAEINPLNESSQGFDGLKDIGETADMSYEPTKNVDPGITGESLIVSVGDSVIKAISREGNDNRPFISQAAILTVLNEAPPANSFRPAYVDTSNTIIATLDDLNFDVLGKYAPLETTPDISEYLPYVEGVWLDHNTEWTQREIHPESTMPAYGRELAKLTSIVGLQLQLDYTDAEKQDVLVAMVQYAIDLYGVLGNGTIDDKENYYWYNNGGHNQGRKLPLLIGGLVLDHAGMLAAVNAEGGDNLLFQEDHQTFYVSQAEIDATVNNDDENLEDYTSADIGLPEWGIRAWDQANSLDADWGSRYRTVTGNTYVVTSLAVRMMDATEQWNWPAFFDYSDRYFSIEGEGVSDSLEGNSIMTSGAELWNVYRAELGDNDYD